MSFKLPSVLTAAQLGEIAFLNGVDADGVLITTDFYNWNGDIPATYGTAASPNGTAIKWGSATVGTSAVVRYYFDTGSNWTAAEKATFLGAMALWSGVAGITFVAASNPGTASLVFFRYGSSTASTTYGVTLSQGYYTATYGSDGTEGTSSAGQIQAAYISAQTQNASGYGDITSFSTYGGYGISAIVHEMGHVLGLGHAGPYNGSVDAATQQFSAYDTRLYSAMSYISPSNGSAAYYGSYDVAGTNWGTTSDGYGRAPYTPMMLDILAAQQLYGVSSGTTLNTAQTFGFNTTIAAGDALRMFFDFTIDTTPVVTLWDSAAGNTLDLSGYDTASVVNLNPGTFSSVAGLTNNLAIAYDTDFDTAIGGGGDDVFIVGSDADSIDGGGGYDTVIFSGAASEYSIVESAGVTEIIRLADGVTDRVSHVEALQFADSVAVACYLRGTRIATAAGERAIEALRIGETVRTAGGALRPVRWIGRRSYGAAVVAANPHLRPVLIRQGALAPGVPRRNLLVSPLHAVMVEGLLVPAAALVNGDSIRRVGAPGPVGYFHVELDGHDVILAEGTPAETYVDDASRQMFDNAAEYAALYGTACPPCPALPRAEEGPAVAALHRRLAARAGLGAAPGGGPLRGHVERYAGGVLEGWATDAAGQGGIELEVTLAGAVLCRLPANRYRSDLDRAGLAEGRCGFSLALPGLAGRVGDLGVRRAADGADLPIGFARAA